MHRSIQFFKIFLEDMKAKQFAHCPTSFFVGVPLQIMGRKVVGYWGKLSNFINKSCAKHLRYITQLFLTIDL